MNAYRCACAAALALTLAAYANHFHNAFHFDDSHTILNNAFIRDTRNIPLFFESAATFSTLPANQSYRPVVTTTLAVDYRLGGGLDPFAFHLTGFSLFVGLCALLVPFYRALMDQARPAEANRWIALLAASSYALHPANAETVNYIIARSEILSTLGVACALVLYARGGIARNAHLYLIPAGLGILSKESGAMFAPLLFVYVALFECQFSMRELMRPRAIASVLYKTWPAFVACVAIVAAAIRMATTYSPGGTSRWHYLLTQPFVLLHYVVTLFLPLSLSADTQWPLVTSPLDPHVLIGIAFIGGMLTAAWVASGRRATRPIAFGILWFFIALLPTSTIVPLSEPMNDHRLFFPFVGLILAVVWAVWLAVAGRSSRARTAVAWAAVAALLVMTYAVRERNAVWHTEESLWLDVTIKSPDNGRGLMNYGVVQLNKGAYAVADAYFTHALTLTPDYAFLHVNIGVLKAALGQDREAERHFREALRDDPGNPVCYTYLARWLRSMGRTEEARLLADAAVKLSPGDLDAIALLRELTPQR